MSVLCNMKRVSITFLPYSPVSNRPRVLQTPLYTTINYATARNTVTHSSHPSHFYRETPVTTFSDDITFFLTTPGLYLLAGHSQKRNRFQLTMWTMTTTVSTTKSRFVSLITPLNRFGSTNVSRFAVNHWIRNGNETFSNKTIKIRNN